MHIVFKNTKLRTIKPNPTKCYRLYTYTMSGDAEGYSYNYLDIEKFDNDSIVICHIINEYFKLDNHGIWRASNDFRIFIRETFIKNNIDYKSLSFYRDMFDNNIANNEFDDVENEDLESCIDHIINLDIFPYDSYTDHWHSIKGAWINYFDDKGVEHEGEFYIDDKKILPIGKIKYVQS